MITLEPHEGLYQKNQCLTAVGIHQVDTYHPFKILIAKFSKYLVNLNVN